MLIYPDGLDSFCCFVHATLKKRILTTFWRVVWFFLLQLWLLWKEVKKIFGPSKPSTSRKRPREQQQQEKEAKKANNASSEKKKSVKWKDLEKEGKEKGSGKEEEVDAVRKEQQEEEERGKAAPNNEKEKKNARLRKRKEKTAPTEKTSGSEEKRKEKACSEEKRKEMVDSEKKCDCDCDCDCDCNPKEEVARGPVVCCEGGTCKGEMIKQLTKESTNVMKNWKNEIIDENQKKFNQLKESIINVVREAKHGSSNNRECDDFWFSSNEMILRHSSFKSKELPPLSSSEMEEFEHKWREQEAIVLEANIKRLALMQEELQLMIAKIRAPVSDRSS